MKTTLLRTVIVAGGYALLFSGCSREREHVAEFSGGAVTTAAFKARYSVYLEGTGSRDNIVLRQKILNNMINEHLILEDARRQGMYNDAEHTRRLEEIRLQAVLDAYALKFSHETMPITEKDLWREFRYFNTKASARYLYAKTEEEAWELKQMLENGSTFELLAMEIFEDPGLAHNGGYLGSFGWGEMEPALEEASFTLPIGEISNPIRLKIGWAIVKVESRIEQPLASEYDYAKNREKLFQAVHDKKVMNLIRNVTDAIVKDLNPSFHEDAVAYVFQNWEYLIAKNARHQPMEVKIDARPEAAALPMVTFGKDSWTVSTFLNKLEKTSERQRKRVKTPGDVRDMAIGLATREELLARARKADLGKDPEVLRRIEAADNEYMLRRWRKSVEDTVGSSGWDQARMMRHYNENRDRYTIPPEVNIAEILVRTESEANRIMEQLRRGADFSALARRFSIRTWAAKKGGELGFGTKARFGVLGEEFLSSSVGALIGPKKVDPYYGVFKIVARREGKPLAFDEALARIREELTASEKPEVFKQAIHTLRNRADVRVFDDGLARMTLE